MNLFDLLLSSEELAEMRQAQQAAMVAAAAHGVSILRIGMDEHGVVRSEVFDLRPGDYHEIEEPAASGAFVQPGGGPILKP